ncbi:UNVERIFIED_CONTAM: hypothetical protein RMT77_013032 [Armadillidium vulgare]
MSAANANPLSEILIYTTNSNKKNEGPPVECLVEEIPMDAHWIFVLKSESVAMYVEAYNKDGKLHPRISYEEPQDVSTKTSFGFVNATAHDIHKLVCESKQRGTTYGFNGGEANSQTFIKEILSKLELRADPLSEILIYTTNSNKKNEGPPVECLVEEIPMDAHWIFVLKSESVAMYVEAYNKDGKLHPRISYEEPQDVSTKTSFGFVNATAHDIHKLVCESKQRGTTYGFNGGEANSQTFIKEILSKLELRADPLSEILIYTTNSNKKNEGPPIECLVEEIPMDAHWIFVFKSESVAMYVDAYNKNGKLATRISYEEPQDVFTKTSFGFVPATANDIPMLVYESSQIGMTFGFNSGKANSQSFIKEILKKLELRVRSELKIINFNKYAN